ncbi:MAG: 16S rRNA (uracil(1498)-N(3))-methyltransferase [Bacteroidales bacterium]|nr:16S rRNA (uracil(1498)-N(3))-methyltransferase [Bacteroidales bacterium]
MFFVPDIATCHLLPEEEAQHAIKVLRLKAGDEIRLTDGNGSFYDAEISGIHGKSCEFRITRKTEVPRRNFRLHIAIAPTKNIDRLEWFVEKTVEIGIDEITPILCQCSERKVLKEERLEKIVISAMKQSLKAYRTQLNPLCSVKEVITNNNYTQKFIAHCDSDTDKILLKNICQKAADTLILIGPEGDFSQEEIALAKANGFRAISLGESRLRTETAGIVACHTVDLINE